MPAEGPVGSDAIAAALQTDSRTLESLVEPYLLHAGLVTRAPRGRVATEPARRQPDSSQAERPRPYRWGRKPHLW
jgi:Holliday junction resolvasome RuvABC ATP-dependent DNA helicase subunit